MQRELKVYLWDLRKYLDEIASFIVGKSFDDYLKERLLQRAIERNFIAIGEILSQMLRHFPETEARIDYATNIKGFRNVLVHEYDRVKDDVVWEVANVSAPVLRQQIDAWLTELDRI
jgi:uncharacterized protein with HEPN domain